LWSPDQLWKTKKINVSSKNLLSHQASSPNEFPVT
jgi:hypothetical protein